ncbi:Zn(II)2Cys6 transcription factor domain-containing protein [Aspergillus luchuensis]|uniref:Uncharacterized protein n=2 Tax=Aspergillus kawachii TaxID=1069201 RepID=A0A7R7X6K2_ASPKA|nr:uncharacterized protein AKAW2_70889A [Aspergillus luchuensis]BCS04011.1 hypothetical protein AKAW2_70889A [Aspergillus luchuensis]BCS15615.1 hypothetical protein ALUC_70848A [Aspergillus luchuensis]
MSDSAPSKTTTTITTTNGPKLRTACDNCQLSKVRCSRGKPSCWRCSQSGVQCVYSPLRRTGRPPKNSDNNAAMRREKATSIQSSTTNPSQNRTPRDIITRDASPDRTSFRRHPPQDAIAANDAPTTCSPVRLQQPPTDLAASSAAPGGAILARHPMGNAQSQELTQNPALSMANLHMGASTIDFSDLDMDLDLDSGIWAVPAMSDLAMDYSQGTIDPTAMTSSETDEMGHITLGSVLSSPSTAFDPHEPRGCAHRAQNNPPTTLLSGLGALSTTMSTVMPISSVSEEIAETGMASPPPSAPTTASSSHHVSSLSGARNRSVGPGTRERASDRPCSQDGTCYKALSGLLAKLGDFDLSPAEAMQLDGLLCIDRELQNKVRMALDCGHCTEMPSNQNLLMIIYMSLDSLLALFEKQQRQHKDSSGSANGYNNRSSSTATAAIVAAAAPRRHLVSHSRLPSSRFPHEKSDDTSSRRLRQFPWTEQSLVVGSFLVDDVVKASFLQRLVLDYIDNVLSILAELERMADKIMKGVNCMISRQKSDDIYKRLYFLRARLLLAINENGTL